jgi:hypothetical protein
MEGRIGAMQLTLYACAGGEIVLPDAGVVLVDRADGGSLIVNPPRTVWERSVLSTDELRLWSFLVAAAAEAMIAVLPQLEGGCINYWEAGNWALNEEAPPRGPKKAPDHRQVHLHLLGRSRTAANPDWAWGEAPRFPAFADRHAWAARNKRLRPDECSDIVAFVERRLRDKFKLGDEQLRAWRRCEICRYPTTAASRCDECRDAA